MKTLQLIVLLTSLLSSIAGFSSEFKVTPQSGRVESRIPAKVISTKEYVGTQERVKIQFLVTSHIPHCQGYVMSEFKDIKNNESSDRISIDLYQILKLHPVVVERNRDGTIRESLRVCPAVYRSNTRIMELEVVVDTQNLETIIEVNGNEALKITADSSEHGYSIENL